VGDLRDLAAVERLAAIADQHGPIEVLVNNAGMTSVGAGHDVAGLLHELTPHDWDDTLARNLSTAFLMCRAVVPGMRSRRYGRIVNVASTTGAVSAFERAAGYAAAKAGMMGLTRALALESAGFGITVNGVAPGWIDTPSLSDGERRAGAASPMGRCGTADEVAAVVAFLASRDASYVSGTLLVVDGANAVVEDVSGRTTVGDR
ncbi:MAG: SDR family oxidoreductase, partial [Ilumatobacteraceae bacterium]